MAGALKSLNLTVINDEIAACRSSLAVHTTQLAAAEHDLESTTSLYSDLSEQYLKALKQYEADDGPISATHDALMAATRKWRAAATRVDSCTAAIDCCKRMVACFEERIGTLEKDAAQLDTDLCCP